MQTPDLAVVNEAFCGVVEQIAFMFPEAVEPADLPLPGEPFVRATMTFAGPIRGRLTIAVPRQACAQIAANVLGMDPDEAFVQQRSDDSLKELLNVTCGHILTGLAGDRPVFDLSIPEVADVDDAGLEALKDASGTLAFLVDDVPALVRLEVEGD